MNILQSKNKMKKSNKRKLLLSFGAVFGWILGSIVGSMIVTGCADNYDSEGRKVYPTNTMVMSYVIFDGHEYVKYVDGYRGSITHSPKCDCLKEKGK